jgi:hypothetical protein
MQVVYNQHEYDVRRAYFTGTDTLRLGQPLCWQESPATASSTKGFPFDVEIPNSGNIGNFAGVVGPSSVGFTGPGFIDVVIPRKGDILQVLVGHYTVTNLTTSHILAVGTDTKYVSATFTDHVSGTGQFVFNTIANYSASSTDMPASLINTLLLQGPLVRMLESARSTDTVSANTGVRSLKWVQFL